jgi:hypothetical protein
MISNHSEEQKSRFIEILLIIWAFLSQNLIYFSVTQLRFAHYSSNLLVTNISRIISIVVLALTVVNIFLILKYTQNQVYRKIIISTN